MSENEESFLSNKSNDDEENTKKKKSKGLSVLEQQYFDQAKERHKANMTKTQVVSGKVFKGEGFISKPEKIIFKDFEVGEPMTQTIHITNSSYSFNSFKLTPLPESIRDYFDIYFTPPGRLSAGMSVPMVIRFTPELNVDIHDWLTLQCETGPVKIEILCTCKKAIIEIENSNIEFGKVIFGESSVVNIVFTNKGALQTEIIFKTLKGDILEKFFSSSMASSMFQVNDKEIEIKQNNSFMQMLEQFEFEKTVTIKGYSTLSVPVTFKPKEISEFSQELIAYIDKFQFSNPINFKISGEGVEVPIYIEKEVYDFQICLLGHIYREKLVFFNRSNNAMKVQISVPKESKQFFEFNPMLGYIQGNSKFEIWVKFKAEKEVLNICAKFMKSPIELQIPFKLIGAGQILPVNFSLKSTLTIDAIDIQPRKIEFGKIFKGTASKISFTMENLSLLPQELMFFPLPREIQIFPDIIPIILLPKEKFSIDAIYKATDCKKENEILTCRIITGSICTREVRIPYSVEVFNCPLTFSNLFLEFPALQEGEKETEIIQIKNNTEKEYIYEFFLPDYEISGLRIAPMVNRIPAGTTFNVYFEYNSFYKKVNSHTMERIKEKEENDPLLNYEEVKLRRIKEEKEKEELKKQEEEEKNKGPKKEIKKPVAPTKKNAKEIEEEQLKELELKKKQEEEEEKKRLNLFH